jgi:hypothetical protein
MPVEESNSRGDDATFIMSTLQDLFNVADILFNLTGSDRRRFCARIVLEDEAHLATIVGDTAEK